MAEKKRRTEIFQAVDSFAFRGVIVQMGDTVIAGHPLLKGRQKLFRPFQPTYGQIDYEAAAAPETAEPEPEPATRPAAEPQPEPAPRAELASAEEPPE